ncbi:MAG: Molecular chaperone (small heat shock protein) [Deltaproteobacteria bacterium]|nr:Molecular chaperone (small heat shock protein) [Deltaproteobacteria bacterium]
MTIVRWWETFGPAMAQADHPVGTWSPAVDIFETDQEIVLQVEVPGVSKEQIHVEVDNGTLLLRGERKIEKEVKEENYHRVERAYGVFQRSFSLPDTVDPEKVRAELKDGLLELRLGKRELAKPKQIQVSVN